MVIISTLVSASIAEEPKRIPLRDNPESATETSNDDQAFITVHKPEDGNGTAVIICPGGGYGGLAIGPEGHGIAQWLNRQGIMGIVLEYRLPKGRAMVPLSDAQRAIRLVRQNAKDWGLKPAHIGHIVQITTTLADQPIKGVDAALASLTKGGLNAVTRSLAIEYADKGIRVNAVSPGIIKMPMHAPETREFLAGLHPLNRMGEVQ